jgi:DNA polymerase-1
VGGKLLLVDASNSIYRAFFALPPLATARGVPTNATLGFTTMLQKVMREEQPDYVVIVWDSPGRKRRDALYADYKANRDAMPDDLRVQFADIRRVVDAYGLLGVEHAGEEADDVIATLVRLARPEGIEVAIVSSDRDLMQLVGDGVVMLDTMRDRRIGPDEVVERFGVSPEAMLDFRALTGDSSDNIPGVKGIGEKGAAQLLAEYGSLDALLEHASEVKGKRPREALLAHADDARLSRELSRMNDELPIDVDWERARLGTPDTEALRAIFAELELKRLLEELGGAGPVPVRAEDVEVRVEHVTGGAELAALATRLSGAQRLGLGCVLEPDEAMRGELVAIVLADASDQAYLIPVRTDEKGAEEPDVLEALRPLFEGKAERRFAGYDLKRDWIALRRRGVELRGRLGDVALAAYVDDPSQQVRRPDILARAYLGRTLADRDVRFGRGARRRPLDRVPELELGEQFGTEAAVALELAEALEARLEERGQRELYDEVEVPLVGVLGRMEVAGVRVDEARLAELGTELRSELGGLERRIYELAGEEFLINSPKQLQRILFEKLALPPTKKTKTGFSTDESVLEELALEFELPREILTWRRQQKLLSTYVDALPKLIHPETGRIHCSFNQTVAATGRLSASNPNLQNIPVRTPSGQRIREAFVPAEGRVLFSADYSQIELRILAHLSGDEALVAAFREGDDVHRRTASHVFDIPLEEVSEEQRSHMKGINFGIIYGSSAFGIARQLGVAQSEAREHIRAYFERYPGVRGYLDSAMKRARERGYAETVFGRRRYLPDLHSRNRVQRSAAERMAVNSAIQGTAADIIKRAMVEIDAGLALPDAPRAEMIISVHDELVFEVHPADLATLEELVVGRMRAVRELSVPIEVHTGSGYSWREAH